MLFLSSFRVILVLIAFVVWTSATPPPPSGRPESSGQRPPPTGGVKAGNLVLQLVRVRIQSAMNVRIRYAFRQDITILLDAETHLVIQWTGVPVQMHDYFVGNAKSNINFDPELDPLDEILAPFVKEPIDGRFETNRDTLTATYRLPTRQPAHLNQPLQLLVGVSVTLQLRDPERNYRNSLLFKHGLVGRFELITLRTNSDHNRNPHQRPDGAGPSRSPA